MNDYSQRLKKLFFCFSLFLFIQSLHAQETFPVNGIFNKNHNYYAFTHAKIYTDYRSIVENATLLIKDGLIVEVGKDVNIPKGTVVYDLKGKSIYPSLIDAYSTYGMPEVKKIPHLQHQGAYAWNEAIKPETDACKLFSEDAKRAEELRELGFGAVLSSPQDGIARGSAVFVSLDDGASNDLVIRDKAASLYSFNKGISTQEYPSSLMGSIALLRQTYLDAGWYKNNQKKKEYNISLEAFNNLQNLPQVFEVEDKLSVLRADRLGDEFKVQYIIKGKGDEYQRLADIKNTNAKLIIPLHFPAAYDVKDPYDAALVSLEEMKHWEMAPANPAMLAKNFIPFAITTSDLKDLKDFWKNLRKAIEYGLSEQEALKSLTYAPAEMLGLSDKVGSLKSGMVANFIITSTDLFDENNVIYENWTQGNQHIITNYNGIDIRGKYKLELGSAKTLTLTIEGEPEKPTGSIALKDTNKTPVNISVFGNLISLDFNLKDDKGDIRLSGNITENPLKFVGKGQFGNGDWTAWTAAFVSADTLKIKQDSVKKIPEIGDVIYPFTAYGEKEEEKSMIDKLKHRYNAVLIKNVAVWTNETEGILKNKDVYITEGRIVRIDDNIQPAKNAFAKVIDGTGKHLTAGIIDEHSHIGVSGEVNEAGQASSAEVRIGDAINSEDINIYRQLAGGVTAAQLLHGSANPIGGQSALVKLRWGKSPEEMKIKGAEGFIKFALGENVKQSNWGNRTRFPQSRMGIEQFYYDAFTRAKEYDTKWKTYENLSEKEKAKTGMPRRDLELEALAEILNKKRFITCHSYVQSEVNMLMHLADSMHFKVNTFTHILEGYKVADKMKQHGAGGSTFSDWWAYKMEVNEAIPYNSALMHDIGVVTAVNSDDPEMARRLNQEAAKAIKYGGLSEEEALKLVTLNPAKLLHLDNRMGSIKVGKDADVVLWSDNPLSIYAKVEKTLVDGIIYFDAEQDLKKREEIRKERARLIQKMLAAKEAGEKTQKPELKQKRLYHCDTVGQYFGNE